jgi:uncharacterized membrane protein YdbT with pleckstrin-like domain
MGYVESTLFPGEYIVYRARGHWGVILDPIFKLAVFVGMVLFALLFLHKIASTRSLDLGRNIAVFILLISFLGGYAAFSAFGSFTDLLVVLINRETTELVITDRRVIAKYGAVQRVAQEIQLSQIEGADFSQTFLGRIFNYGKVLVRGTGGYVILIPGISDPLEFKRIVTHNIPGLRYGQRLL